MDDNIHVIYRGYEKGRYKIKDKEYVSCADMAPNGKYIVPKFSLLNAMRAIIERVFYIKNATLGIFTPPPIPLTNIFLKLKEFRRIVLNHIYDNHGRWACMLTDKQFLDLTPPDKLKLYTEVARKLEGSRVTRSSSDIKSFIKIEKTENLNKTDPVFRVVSPRSPAFNFWLGKYIKHYEKKLFHGIDSMWEGPTVMKGYNAKEIAEHIHRKWNLFDNTVAVGLDMSRFDQHIGRSALVFEHSFYNALYDKDKYLKELLGWQLDYKCYMCTSDGNLIKYKAGCRCSGDQNTGLGNTILMCALLWRLRQETGIPFEVVDNGDDCVLFMSKDQYLKFKEFPLTKFMVEYGFDVTIEKAVNILEQVKFCQCQPIYSNDGTYIMCRDPRTALYKDTLSLNTHYKQKSFDHWRNSIAQCGLSLCAGIPVFQEFYRAFGKGSVINTNLDGASFGLKNSGLYWLSRKLLNKDSTITDSTRLSYWKAFGITPEFQMEMEKYYTNVEIRNLNRGPFGFEQPQPYNTPTFNE